MLTSGVNVPLTLRLFLDFLRAKMWSAMERSGELRRAPSRLIALHCALESSGALRGRCRDAIVADADEVSDTTHTHTAQYSSKMNREEVDTCDCGGMTALNDKPQ